MAMHTRGEPAGEPLETEGLRARKKREMREFLSNTATALFLERGFDEVKVSEIAAACGVSEKTVYNYFPTKELLLLDRYEEMETAIRGALGVDGNGFSPVDAAVRVIEAELAEMTVQFGELGGGPESITMIHRFGDLVDGTPSLRAAQRDQMDRMVQVAAEALAERIGLQPDDPEPQIAADAIMGLWRIEFRAMHKYADGVNTPEQMQEKVVAEVRRAARLIETGLWASGLVMPATGKREQIRAAAEAAAAAKRQVHATMREAKLAWREAAREAALEARAEARRARGR